MADSEDDEATRLARKAAKKAARAAAAATAAAPADEQHAGEAGAAGAGGAAGKKRARAEEGPAAAASAGAAPKRGGGGGGVSSAGPASDEDAAEAPAAPLPTAAFLALHKLSVRGGPAGFAMPAPLQRFEDAPFAAPLQKALLAAGYAAPTTTQAVSWPVAMLGLNLVSVARTGSGKTLGFLMPILHALHTSGAAPAAAFARPMYSFGKPGGSGSGGSGASGPRVLVMAPTRELACQTEVEATKFGRATGLRACCVYGGAAKGPQIQGVRVSDIVVGTPGRLQDLHDMGVLSFAGVKFLVLDEADRMLDMGFEEAIRAIIKECPKAEQRQTLLFTATWPREVQRLADEFCPGSVHIASGDSNVLAANAAIKQHVQLVSGDAAKAEALGALFTKLFMEAPAGAAPGAAATAVRAGHGKAIVFVKFKANANKVAQLLWDAGFAVNTLHGDMEQRERTQVIGHFRTGEVRVLVATDVAARGLDVKDVTDVINFDFPFGRNGCEDYVHRIGRTGRAGSDGSAWTFFDPREDGKNARGLVELLVGAKQEVPEELKALAGRGFGGGGGGRFGGGGGRGGRGGGRGGFRSKPRW